MNYNNYTLNDYIEDIDKYGLKLTWHKILINTLNNNMESYIFKVENYGELYEIGLEYINKENKKENGKYYTPKDVCNLMSKWFVPLKGENICDVGCGVGNLILSYFDVIGTRRTCELLKNGNVFIYDNDEIAIEICKYSIAIKYGKEYLKKIKVKCCDFLDSKVKLPKNSKVISNPPYYRICDMDSTWNITPIILTSKELYSAFMEKIITQSVASVIITPYSYIGGTKFFALRKLMNNYNGFVVSFDNVPGNIFNGRKHGIFNSNKSNSVRAAITVVENKEGINGFKFSPLVRFKTEERAKILNDDLLYSIINDKYQQVDNNKKVYYKCHTSLFHILDKWEECSNKKMSNLINGDTDDIICVPTTCRYFTVGSKRDLSRDGKRLIRVKDNKYYNYVYCMLNSSFAYWYWRIYDGGINCPLTIINSIPVFYDILNEQQKNKLDEIAMDMQNNESKYLVYKMNANRKQENVKFPIFYRNEINKVFFNALGILDSVSVLDKVHSSSFFADNEGDDDE